jgi:hypothetical protein
MILYGLKKSLWFNCSFFCKTTFSIIKVASNRWMDDNDLLLEDKRVDCGLKVRVSDAIGSIECPAKSACLSANLSA